MKNINAKTFIAVLGLVGVLSFASVGHAAETKLWQVIIIGDSIMHGSQEPASNSLFHFNTTTASILLNENDLSVHNISRGWQTLSSAAANGVGGAVNYLTMNANGKPMYSDDKNTMRTAVVIQLGHNDWYLNQDNQETIRRNYISLLESINRSELVEVFCVVPIGARWDSEHYLNAHDDSYEDTRATVRGVADSGFCTLIETADWFTETDIYDGYCIPDGLHLGDRGHEIYARRLLEAIE
jgi:lysophospholipase L1-like esterase